MFERKKIGYLDKSERTMVRAMCGAKLADRKNTEDIMDVLGLNQIINKMAKASGMRWLGHVLRKEDSDVVRNALKFNAERRRKRERSKNRGESKWKKCN